MKTEVVLKFDSWEEVMANKQFNENRSCIEIDSASLLGFSSLGLMKTEVVLKSL